MQLSLYSVRIGRAHSSTMDALVQEYLRRMHSPWRADSRLFRTETALLEALETQRRATLTMVWLLDSRGKAFTSDQLAASVQAARDTGHRHLIAAIGPPDGWSPAALTPVSANGATAMLLSLGPMTLPHELARLVIAEQLYRATTILAGHPYHLGHE